MIYMEKSMYLLDSCELESVIRKVFQEILDSRESKQEGNLLTIAETANQLCVNKSTLWRWEKAKYLVPVRFGGSVRYRQSDIERICKG